MLHRPQRHIRAQGPRKAYEHPAYVAVWRMAFFRSIIGNVLWNSHFVYLGSKTTFYFRNGTRDIAQWLTTIRHVAFFLTHVSISIHCVAPESFMPGVWVPTVVLSGYYATVRKRVITVDITRRPGLTGSTAYCYRRVTDVVTSWWWRIAVSNTCTQYIQPVM